MLAFVADEETLQKGSDSLIKTRKDFFRNVKLGVVGEPSENKIRLSQRGLFMTRAKFFGKAVHGSRPWAGESAILKALASETGKELWQVVNSKAEKMPFPVGNVVGGGMHSSSVALRPNFQEFLVIPQASRFSDNLKIMQFVYSAIGKQLGASLVNDEGAWLVSCDDEKVLDILESVRKVAEKKFGAEVGIGIDAACSTLFQDGIYKYKTKSLKRF